MKHKFSVSAPGKLILLGEHAVVYGKPAIIAAVDKRCYVTISGRNDGLIKIISKNLNIQILTDIQKIRDKFNHVQKIHKKYILNNDIELLKLISKETAEYPQIIIGQFLDYFNTLGEGQGEGYGFDLIIDSEIPPGAGMGSSAALAVSIIGSLFLFSNKTFDNKIINEIAFLAEQKKHGRPSGGDNSASSAGGLLLFKKDQDIKFLDLNISPQILKNIYFTNTGTPVETTGEMVSLVNKLNKSNPALTKKIYLSQEKLVEDLYYALKNNIPENIPEIIKEGEKNLEKLGVVSEYVKKIIREIEKSGGTAKICGGGGRKKATGFLLVYHPNRQALEHVLKSHSLTFSHEKLGVEGVRREL